MMNLSAPLFVKPRSSACKRQSGLRWQSLVVMTCLQVAVAFGSAHAEEGTHKQTQLQLKSSVMWERSSKHIYPPGLSAVITGEQKERHYRIEQYYSAAVQTASLRIYIRAPWLAGQALAVEAQRGLDSPYLNVLPAQCDREPSRGEQGALLGYRCVSDFTLRGDLPAGALGIAMSFAGHHGEAIHPNSVFWLIVPAPSPVGPALVAFPAKAQAREPSAFALPAQALVASKVVRITLDGNFSLGSGFLTRDLGPIQTLFPDGFAEDSRGDELMTACPALYVVTAAHLFPGGFAASAKDVGLEQDHNGLPHDERAFDAGTVYDIAISGQDIAAGAARLVAKNEVTDLAVLRLNGAGLNHAQQAQGVADCQQLSGLDWAEHIEAGERVFPLGFAIAGQGAYLQKHLQKQGQIAEYPTEDTSNFGPIAKFKVAASDGRKGSLLAESGMSGGPIVNSEGQVVGISVEKPLASNSLIALDFTSLAQTAGSDYFRNHTADRDCVLRFNPFDRVLEMTNLDPRCDYGDFGSHSAMGPLRGHWVLQEVLTLADEAKASSMAGYDLKNGHSIINGFTIVEGRQILRTTPLVVNRQNIAQVNQSQLLGGFKIDPLSFHPLAPLGVRLLRSPLPIQSAGLTGGHGPLVVGVRSGLDDHGFTPLYSLRDFAIWLRKQEGVADLPAKLCYQEKGCGGGL